MFTGLTEAIGTLSRREANGPSARLSLTCTLPGEPLALGESVAVDGVCLTVATIQRDGFDADASAETLARTTLGQKGPGSQVNLERALAAGARMGGHIVTGHVDAVGTVAKREPVGTAARLTFAFPKELARFFAEKGSVAVNGVSLTVNGVHGESFDVTLIPHTLGRTTLDALRPGDRVNLEVDVIARYVARMLDVDGAHAPEKADAAFRAHLERNGFL